MTMLFGSSGIGEPAYRGAIYLGSDPTTHAGLGLISPAEAAELGLEVSNGAPEPVRLELEYDPRGDWREGLEWKLPTWAVFAAAVALLAWKAGGRIGA